MVINPNWHVGDFSTSSLCCWSLKLCSLLTCRFVKCCCNVPILTRLKRKDCEPFLWEDYHLFNYHISQSTPVNGLLNPLCLTKKVNFRVEQRLIWLQYFAPLVRADFILLFLYFDTSALKKTSHKFKELTSFSIHLEWLVILKQK